jgi:hypothetical protein
VSTIDAANNAIIETTTLEEALAEVRLKTARSTVAALESETKELDSYRDARRLFKDSITSEAINDMVA